LAGVALLLAGLPLLTTVNWRPAAPAPVSLEGWPAPPGGSWEQPGEIVVDFRDDALAGTIGALAGRLGLQLVENSAVDGDAHLMRATVPPEREPALLEQLRREPLVEAAEPLRLYTSLWKPNDPRYKEQWHLQMIGMEKAWDVTRGKGATVAVIDTGVAFENDAKCYRAKDFAETKFVKGYDFIAKDEHPNDDNGHGTHVAGTIAESTNNGEGCAGIAFEAKVMPLKVLTAEGWGNSADIGSAIRFAADHGADIINMSLGGPSPDSVMGNACKYAYKKGVTIVCAAGNSGREGVGYPAAFPECIAVSAVGPKGELSYYSSWGKQICLAAPGGDTSYGPQYGVLQNTVRPEDDYYFFQGTSMASPHVAGVAALIRSRGVKEPDKIREVLEKSATPKSPKNKYGAGLLDAAQAVKIAGEEKREPLARWAFALVLAGFGFGLATFRARRVGLGHIPVAATLCFLLGTQLPEWLTSGWGQISLPNVIGHSALIPLGLLALGITHRPALRYLAALAAGFGAHLLWDGLRAAAPFSYHAGWTAVPWLWVNLVIAAAVAITALRRGYQEE
jgi:serine protease